MDKCPKCKEEIDEGDDRISYGRDGKPYCYICGYHHTETVEVKPNSSHSSGYPLARIMKKKEQEIIEEIRNHANCSECNLYYTGQAKKNKCMDKHEYNVSVRWDNILKALSLLKKEHEKDMINWKEESKHFKEILSDNVELKKELELEIHKSFTYFKEKLKALKEVNELKEFIKGECVTRDEANKSIHEAIQVIKKKCEKEKEEIFKEIEDYLGELSVDDRYDNVTLIAVLNFLTKQQHKQKHTSPKKR